MVGEAGGSITVITDLLWLEIEFEVELLFAVVPTCSSISIFAFDFK
jgi:hypothetical protein